LIKNISLSIIGRLLKIYTPYPENEKTLLKKLEEYKPVKK